MDRYVIEYKCPACGEVNWFAVYQVLSGYKVLHCEKCDARSRIVFKELEVKSVERVV